MNYKIVELDGLPFESQREKEAAQKVVAIVAKTNPYYRGNIEKVIKDVRTLWAVTLQYPGAYDAATGGVIVRKLTSLFNNSKICIKIELHNCIIDNIYHAINKK